MVWGTSEGVCRTDVGDRAFAMVQESSNAYPALGSFKLSGRQVGRLKDIYELRMDRTW